MPRSQRQVPNLYFGKPGRLVTLPYPLGAIERTAERQSYDFLTGSGLHQVSLLALASRPYVLTWNALHQDTFTRLEQYRLGANGPGPWAYIDPSAANLLPANVAAAGGLLRDATDLEVNTNGGTVTANSDLAFIHRATGDRSLRWLMGATIDANPTLTVSSQFRNWYGHPVAPSVSYAFSSWIRVDGTVETSGTISMRIGWYDLAGALISESTGGNVAVTSTWQRLSVIASSPSNAAYGVPRWVATGATLAVGGSFYIDEPLWEQDSVVNDWAPGTGIRPVEMVALTEAVPFEARMRTGIQLSLRELTK